MSELQANNFLEKERLGKLMVKYSIPCVISLLIATLYNIVDQIFIANADYLGAYGNAANSVVFPLTVFALAVAMMIGDGCCTFVSIHLGAKKPEDARRGVGSSVIALIAAGLALMVIYLVFQDPILTMFGALDPVFGQTEYSHIPTAVVGIVMKFFQVMVSIAVGLSSGCIPISGYNYGAKRLDRVRSLMHLLTLVEAAVGLVATVLFLVFPRQLAMLFGAANESVYYMDFSIKCIRLFLCTSVLACVNKGAALFLQSLGKAKESTALSMLREIALGVSLPLILPIFFGLDGILFFMAVADVVTFAATAVILTRLDKRLHAQQISGADT